MQQFSIQTHCHRHTDESRYPAKQQTRAANKTDVVSLREAYLNFWIPTFVGMTGVSLSVAASLEWQTLMAEPDNRRDDGELRMMGYVLMADRLYCVVFTDRDDMRRIISLKKANLREVKFYGSM